MSPLDAIAYCLRRSTLAAVGLVAVNATPLVAQTRHVLVLYGERSALPGIQIIDRGLSEELARRLGPDLQLYREDLDVSRFDDTAHVEQFTAYLAAKYSDIPIDAVVPVMEPAVDVALRLRGIAFGEEVPVVFWRLGGRPPPTLPPNVTGAYVHPPFARTLELAMELEPGIERAVVVSGESRFDRDIRRYAEMELRAFEDRLEIDYPTGLSLDGWRSMVSGLGPGTVVLYGTILRDGADRAHVARDAVQAISASSAVPVYGISDLFLGYGIVGGRMHSLEGNGAAVAELAALAIESDITPPPVDLPSGAAILDDRQLERWGISEARLPADAVVMHESPSWLSRRWVLMAAIAGMLAEAGIIAGLLFQRLHRRRAEARLRENEQRFRHLADRVPVMIWMTGADGEFHFLNRSWLDFSSPAGGDAVDRRWTDRVHPEERERSEEALSRSAETGDDFSLECRMRRHDGEWRWMLCNGVPRMSDGGEFLGHIGTCIDITRRKRAELADQRHAEELARVSRVATMGAFTASVAHELNQPLTAILSNAEAAVRFLDREEPPLAEVSEILSDVARDGQRAGDIIRRMRALLERHEIDRSDVELNAIVCEVLAVVRLEAMARRVSIEFQPRQLEVFAIGDRVHLQQVLLNLLLNAFEAIGEVEGGERRVTIETDAPGDAWARVTVSDTGPGIPADVLPHLFEPFYTTKAEGLGMGLSISRTIIEAHGGVLRAENPASGGTAFHVEIPREGGLAESPMRRAEPDA